MPSRFEAPSALSEAQRSEVRQRLAEMEADPGLQVPFAETDAVQMLKEIKKTAGLTRVDVLLKPLMNTNFNRR